MITIPFSPRGAQDDVCRALHQSTSSRTGIQYLQRKRFASLRGPSSQRIDEGSTTAIAVRSHKTNTVTTFESDPEEPLASVTVTVMVRLRCRSTMYVCPSL